jgi:hypothetical protein
MWDIDRLAAQLSKRPEHRAGCEAEKQSSAIRAAIHGWLAKRAGAEGIDAAGMSQISSPRPIVSPDIHIVSVKSPEDYFLPHCSLPESAGVAKNAPGKSARSPEYPRLGLTRPWAHHTVCQTKGALR